MDALRLSTLSKNPLDADGKKRAQAVKTAGEFEQVFMRSMVSSLRQTGKLDDGGMFGSGPGSDTFGDWFDQNLAEQIGRTSDIGVAKQVLDDLERRGEMTSDVTTRAKLDAKLAAAQNAAADRSYKSTSNATPAGGFDVVL